MSSSLLIAKKKLPFSSDSCIVTYQRPWKSAGLFLFWGNLYQLSLNLAVFCKKIKQNQLHTVYFELPIEI